MAPGGRLEGSLGVYFVGSLVGPLGGLPEDGLEIPLGDSLVATLGDPLVLDPGGSLWAIPEAPREGSLDGPLGDSLVATLEDLPLCPLGVSQGGPSVGSQEGLLGGLLMTILGDSLESPLVAIPERSLGCGPVGPVPSALFLSPLCPPHGALRSRFDCA